MNAAIPTHEWHFQYPRHPRSVGRARSALLAEAHAWRVPDDIAETAVLLLSELMTNACQHARVPPGRDIAARALLRDHTLRVEVSDAGNTLPCPRGTPASPDDERGRGLALVMALADAWDSHPRAHGIGKTVWFELKLIPVV
jgi:anti-sigma regulatory factor (Ser/Thr protein kinase)